MADEALDNLGRKIDTANMSIGELKGLIASLMKSKVGPSKPIGGAKDDPAKKLSTLFEKYVKDFDKESKEQKKLLERIANGIKEMKSQKAKEKKQDKGSFAEKAGKTLNKSIKPSKEDQTVAKSTKALADIFGKKGSGYTHDIYCERFLKEIYGVLVEIAKAKGVTRLSPEKIEEEIKSEKAKKETRPETTARAAFEEEIYDELYGGTKDWERYSFDIDNFSEAIGWLWEGEDALKQQKWLAHSRLGDIMEETGMSRQQAREAKKQAELTEKSNQVFQEGLRKVGETASKLQEIFLGFNAFQTVFKGIVEEERKFTQDIRQAAYETAGVTKESQKLQRSFEDIGKTAKITGFDRTEYQKSYINALKSGIKDQKKAQTLTTTQLNTEKQIGVEAGSLGDSFIKLNNELKFTNDQTADVGRGIREVGRNTGLVGKELAAVVSSSQQFVDQMRKAGTATASSVKNVIGLQAEFKKLGITDTANKLLSAISSTTGFYEAGAETQSLIANAASRVGLATDMTTGSIIKSNEKLKLLNKGLMQTANSLGLGGSNLEEMRANFENLSDEAKRAINLRFKGAFGMEAGEVLGTIEAFENKTKTLGEKLADLNKEKAKNLTLEERAALAEKERSLRLSAGLGALTALSEAAKDVTNMDQALAKFGKRRSEFEGDIKALGGAWSSETDAARTAIQSSVSALNEGLKKAGKKGLSIDSRTIEKALKDPAALRELTAQITKGEQELATAQKAQADPLTSMDQTLKEINDGIRGMSQGIISGIFNSPIGRALLGLTAVFGFLITGLTTIRSGITQMISFVYHLQKFLSSAFAGGGGFGKIKEKGLEFLRGSKKTPETKLEESTKKTEEAAKRTAESNDSILSVLKEIRDCICSKTTRATTAAGKSGEARPEKTPVSVTEKQQAKNIKQETKNVKQQAKNIKQDTKLLKQEVAAPEAKGISESGFDLNKLISSGKEMGKAALAVTILGLGAVALGSAIVFIAKGILSSFNLDMKTIMEVAGAVAALAAAGGAIVGAGYIAYEALQKDKNAQEGEKVTKEFNTKLLKQVAIISLMGPALVLLGAVIVKAAQLITQGFGLDMGTVAEVAGSVVAIVGAAGALVAGAATAFEGLEELGKNDTFKKLMENPWETAKVIGKAALALVVLAPALVLLAASIVKISQLIMGMFGLDMGAAAKVAGDIGVLIGAAGFIALATLGATFGLKLLGQFADEIMNSIDDIAIGAVALLLLAPAITLLAAGLVTIIRAILGIFGIDAGVAAKAAWDVGSLIAATGVIAFSVMAAMAGLMALGGAIGFLTGPQAIVAAVLMGLGAAALLFLTPVVVALSAAVIDFARAVMAVLIDPEKAILAAQNVGKIIGAAASIALSVLASMAGLALLGAAIPILPYAAGLMFLGTAALLLLTPAVIGLASAVIYMAEGLIKRLIDPKHAEEIVGALNGVLGAASDIAWSILSMAGGLSILGTMVGLAPIIASLMWMGVQALRIISWPVVSFVNMIKDFHESISFVDPKDAIKMGEESAAIFHSVGIVAENILKTRDALLSSVGANNWGWFGTASEGMRQGANAIRALMLPVLSFVISIKSFYNLISAIINPEKASEMGRGIASILCAVGAVVNGILMVKQGLIGLRGAAGGFFSWLTGDPITQMYEGSAALDKLKAPVKDFIQKTVNFYKELASIVNPEEATKMGNGVASILNAVGNVVRGILWVKEGMIGLKGAAGGSWFGWLIGGDVVSQMAEGSIALEKLKEPVKGFIKSTVKFYNDVVSIISPDKAKEAGNGVGTILGAVGFVTLKIVEAKDALVALSKTGGWNGIDSIVSQMSKGGEALSKIMWPVVDYALKIQLFSNVLQSMFGSTESVVKSANGVANILRAIGFITANILSSAKALASINASKLSSAFSNSFKIINEGMIAPIKNNLAATSELEESLHQLDLVLMIAEKMGKISEACRGLSPVSLGAPMEGKLTSSSMGGTTSDIAISQRNESQQADTMQDSTRVLSEFVETSLRGKGIIVRNGTTAVNAVPPGVGVAGESVQTKIQRERASSSPNKSEVTSSELSDIANNTEQQNLILQKMEKLLQEFVELAKPQSDISRAGGYPEPPQNNSVVGKPTNYFRRTIGNVNNTPSKAIVNVGAKAVS